jgi:hypothetical protein
MIDSDALFREAFPGPIAKAIRPIGPKKSHVSAGPGRSDGLVSAFTSSESFEFASQDGLSRLRQALAKNNEVGVG